MLIRELVTKIGFNVDDKKLKDLDKSLASVRKTILAVAAAGAAAATGLFALAQSTANTGDRVAKTARDVGLAAGALQEYEFAAEQAGITNEQLATGLTLFNRNIGQAAKGTGAAVSAFEELGISLKDNEGNLKSNEVLLAEVSDAMAGIDDAARRGAIAQELFGRSGARMGVFLSAGSAEVQLLRDRARELGMVLDEQTLDASEKFNDTLNEMRKVIGGLKNVIGADLLPVITNVVEKFIQFTLANRELIKQRLQSFILGTVAAVKALFSVVSTIARTFSFFAQVVGGVENALKLIIGTMLAFKAIAFAKSLLVIIQALWAARSAMLAFSLAAAASPLGLIAIGVAAATAIVSFLRLTDAGEYVFQVLTKAIFRVLSALMSLVKTIFTLPMTILRGIGSIFSGLINLAQNSSSFILQLVVNMLSGMLSAFTGVLTSIGGLFLNILVPPIQFIINLITGLLDKLGIVRDAVGAITGAAGAVIGGGVDLIGRGGSAISGAASRVGQFLGFGGPTDVNQPDIANQAIRPTNVSNINGGSRQINVNSEVNVTVPPGTEAEQQRFLRQAARESFRAEYERELERVLYENPELE